MPSSAGMQRGGELLRSRPRGSPVDHPRLDLLRHRSLYLWRSWPPDEVLHQRRSLNRVQDGWRITRPLTDWLARYVGASAT
jgi:uncharacterized protein (DUF2461 family)